MGDPERELERAAERKRRREAGAQAAEDARQARDLASVDDRRRLARRNVLVTSLGGGRAIQGVAIGGTLLVWIGLGVALLLRLHLSEGWTELCMLGMSGVAIVLLFTVPDLVQGEIADVRVRRLRRFGDRFDAAGYRDLMSEKRGVGTVVVRVDFERPWSGDRQAAADAVLGWLPELAAARWDGEALAISSKELEGREDVPPAFGGTGGGRRFTNVALHRCFRRIVRRVIPKLAAVTPIRRFAVEIDGEVLPWDTKANA